MNFLKKIFGSKESISHETDKLTIKEFWAWFTDNQSKFHEAVKSKSNIQFEFIEPVFNKLNQIRHGAFILAGMVDEDKAELIFTAEGNLLYFPYISSIVDAAPEFLNWKFTAFKPAMESSSFGIEMRNKSFTTENIFFYPENDENYPDEISIKLTYADSYDDDQVDLIENGTFIFVENYIGEIKMATQIDKLEFEHKVNSEIELNPISKLTDYIKWRVKEFTEKYEGTIHDSDNANYSSMEWETENNAIVGVVNADLIKWDKKASHPWIMIITIKFDEHENNGMPSEGALKSYYDFEDKLRELLPDKEGYVHVAQTTGLGKREIYYASKDYVRPIQVLENFKTEVEFEYEIEVFKDKYWKSMKHFEH